MHYLLYYKRKLSSRALEAEYRLLENKSLGSEIIINAIKKMIITVRDFLVRKSEVLNKVSIRVIICGNLY